MIRNRLILPATTLFLAGCCVMMLEIVAGRIVAEQLGSSIYTWTSVIGITLTGISVGNYIGGRLADRFRAANTLAILFTFCSAVCLAVIILNNLMSGWEYLWHFDWPFHVIMHVVVLLVMPGVTLGMISPLATKYALDLGLPKGETVGVMFALVAAGSIAGTFLAGFYLISALGPTNIFILLSVLLLLQAFLYSARIWVAYVWSAVLITLIIIAVSPAPKMEKLAVKLSLRPLPERRVLYEDQTRYCKIRIKQEILKPDIRSFEQDKLIHSVIFMDDVTDLQASYTRIFAAVTDAGFKKKNRFSAMFVGGGGYVFPRYLKAKWPRCEIDVVEIDPGVTKAAILAFGLNPNLVNTVTDDARNYVNILTDQRRPVKKYDLIYEDAINDFTVPFQLTTRQFHEKIKQVLSDDGIYMINFIDSYDCGRFLAP